MRKIVLVAPPAGLMRVKRPPADRPTQVREAIREAMKHEPLWLRIAAYQVGANASEAALERLWRLLK